MPQVDLSALTSQELRQRLDSSRARGDAALAYEILREMAARREAAASAPRRPLGRRRASQPHIVDIDLGDPLEKDELPPLPGWRRAAAIADAPDAEVEQAEVDGAEGADLQSEPAPAPEPEPQPPLAPFPRKKLKVRAAPAPAAELETQASGPGAQSASPVEPESFTISTEPELRLRPGEFQQPRKARRNPMRIAAILLIAIGGGAGLGWWAGSASHMALPLSLPALPLALPWAGGGAAADRAPSPESRMLEISTDEAAPPPPPPAASEPVAEPSPPPVTEAQAETGETADAVSPEPTIEPAPVPEKPVTEANGACAAEPTPADRVICGDPALQDLQRDLREAYADALEAHEDRGLLRQRQLAWRDARNTVTDPERLTRLYEERIRKLKSATAEARTQH